MAVISVTVTESTEQIMAGIPKAITIATNIPSSIFFTLDGTIPTLFSEMYTGIVYLPTDKLTVILNIMATNGTDTSPIITETYLTNMLNNTRLPHSATDAQAGESIPDLYPFGTNPLQPMGHYMNPGDASITVNNPALPSTGTGFDGEGNPVGFTNQPYNLENYSIVYSTRDAEGQTGLGVGNLPANVKIIPETAPPETSQQYSALFDPRAFVIFQDTELENPADPPNINRQFFSLENSERIRDGNNYYNSGLDSPPVSGAFLRSHYNPRDNTITYYYLDSIANKWIISKTKYEPNGNAITNLSGIVSSREPGSKYVFEWVPFTRRVLF